MSTRKINDRALWRGRGGAIAVLIVLILIGLTPMAVARASQRSAPFSVLSPQIRVRPTSGPAGTQVRIRGQGFTFSIQCSIVISFTDANGTSTELGLLPGEPEFLTHEMIPSGAAIGSGMVNAVQNLRYDPRFHRCTFPSNGAHAIFTVTGLTPMAVARAVDRSVIPSTRSKQIRVRPTFGPGGTNITVQGRGFSIYYCSITISFTDAQGILTVLDTLGPTSTFLVNEVIPSGAAIGLGTVDAAQNAYNPATHRCSYFTPAATASFKVTGVLGKG